MTTSPDKDNNEPRSTLEITFLLGRYIPPLSPSLSLLRTRLTIKDRFRCQETIREGWGTHMRGEVEVIWLGGMI